MKPATADNLAALREARRAAREAEQAAKLAEHIQAAVAACPPLTDVQRDRLATLLRPAGTDRYVAPREPSRQQQERAAARKLAARQTEDAEKISRAVLACDVCNVPRFVHQNSSNDHEWVPGRVDRIVAKIRAGDLPASRS